MASEIYEPLNSTQDVRVIVLHPGLRGMTIKCDLMSFSLAHKFLPYEALSYEWGSPNGTQTEILLQGSRFPVRDNLWLALHCLRLESRKRVLWIDAICINQTDVKERNSQVGLMGRIYSHASCVRVWLGPEGRGSGQALSLLGRLWQNIGHVEHDALQEQIENKATLEAYAPFSSSAEIVEDIEEYTSAWFGFDHNGEFASTESAEKNMMALFYLHVEAWIGLADLLSRRYWTRMWIVQEVVLARKVTIHCGWDSIDGAVFDGALTDISAFDVSRNSATPSSIQKCIVRVNNSPGIRISKRRGHGKNQTLIELLEACLESKSHDPRDKIYALLGMAKDVPPDAISIDYARPVTRLKIDVVRFLQQQGNWFGHRYSRVCSLVDGLLEDKDEPMADEDTVYRGFEDLHWLLDARARAMIRRLERVKGEAARMILRRERRHHKEIWREFERLKRDFERWKAEKTTLAKKSSDSR